MEFSADPFKASEVSQSCWSMCHNGVAIPPELLPSLLPIYRDDETRAAYEDVANFFYCMDACDEQYLVKRITFILPFVAGGINQRVSKLSTTFDLESDFGLFWAFLQVCALLEVSFAAFSCAPIVAAITKRFAVTTAKRLD